MSARGALSTVRRRLLGLAFLLSVVLFIGLTVGIYQKAFTPTVDVELQAGSTGNQLAPQSDVKIRGVIIGEVRSIRATGTGSELELALDPNKVGAVPANVSAQFLPKTLFGERYVSLEMPEHPSSQRLASNDVIEQDHSASAVELERVLSDTMPVLQAVHPEELASTLNALDQALSGRGQSLGQTLSQLNTYLNGLNPSIPDLQKNMRELVGFANTYQQAAPDLVEALKNFSTTARTVVQQRQNLDALTTQVTTTSGDLTSFLNANSQNIIQLNQSSRPTLDVLAKYAPEYPCLFQEMSQFVPRIRQAFGAGANEPGLHITLEVTNTRGKYVPNQDEPEFADKRGPECYPDPAPNVPAPEYPPGGPFKDGSKPTPPSKSSPAVSVPPSNGPSSNGPATTSSQSADLGLENSPAERDFVSVVLAPTMGLPPDQVPQWGSLLVGPLLRGAEVSYR
jgi:phospholipid/cholesterol/gamma-HCH transport system substrate-binding protein